MASFVRSTVSGVVSVATSRSCCQGDAAAQNANTAQLLPYLNGILANRDVPDPDRRQANWMPCAMLSAGRLDSDMSR